MAWIKLPQCGSKYKTVKVTDGGGVRTEETKKTAVKSDILNVGISLFFHDGISSAGKRDDFDFDLLDNEQKVVPSNLTVSEYYEKSKIKIIRYFVVSSRKGQSENNSMFINESNKSASVKLLFREDKSNAPSPSVPKSIEPHCEIEPISVHEVTEQHMKTDKIAKGEICLNAQPKSAETENKNKLVLMDIVSEIPFAELLITTIKLGSGAFGTVHKGSWAGSKVAVKEVSLKRVSQETKKQILTEVLLHSRVRHPNIVQFMAVAQQPSSIFIVT